MSEEASSSSTSTSQIFMDTPVVYIPGPHPMLPLNPPPGYSTNQLVGGALAAAIILIALVTLFSRRKQKSRGRTLLLVGPSDGGKTTILSTLAYGQPLPSHTSLQPNTIITSIDSLRHDLPVIDIPGHPRIREQFKEHLTDAKVVAFVVDANTVSRNGAAVAEHLHTVMHALCSLPPSVTLPQLVVLAHKSDLLKSSSSSAGASAGDLAINRVRSVLERELERRRAAQAGGVVIEGMSSINSGADNEADTGMGGLECANPQEGFKFANWEAGDIAFLGTSVRAGSSEKEKGRTGLAGLEEWIVDTFSSS